MLKHFITNIFLLYLGVSSLSAQLLEIPFELKNDIILIEVAINNNTHANTFVFDTGATSDVLDSEVANRLGLKANYKQEVRGAGGTTTFDILINQKLTLENTIQIENTNLVLVDLDKLRAKLEKDFDGIIGYSLLRKYVTRIDYNNQKIFLYEKIQDVDTQDYKPIPFKLERGIPIPQFDVSITLRNDLVFRDKILFDSGAALTLSVNTPYNKKKKISKKTAKRLLSETENLNSKSISEDIVIKSMNIGEFTLGEMVISLSNDKDGVSNYKGFLGILGAKVISRFNVILDYSSSTLYLQPNKNFDKKFDFPMSGLTLRKVNNNIIIYRVQKTSPAYEKGIRKGDKLISINNDNSNDIEAFRKLLKEEGKICQLVLLSKEGNKKEIELKLERLL